MVEKLKTKVFGRKQGTASWKNCQLKERSRDGEKPADIKARQ